MKIYKQAVLPKDFKANGIACGIKKSHKLDLALFYSNVPAKASCKFTANKILAAPVRINKRYLKNNKSFRAIIANSGNANCFTGDIGIKDARLSTELLAGVLNIKKESLLVASTGIIGRRLPVRKIKAGIPKLVAGLSSQGIDKAKSAILTSDTFAKGIAVKFQIGRQVVTICGVAKGAGMIAPNMATMLAFILTDAKITQRALDKALSICVDNSFNCITVDGCMSTNDSVMMLANGAADNPLIDKGKYFDLFTRAAGLVCLELAKMVIRDAEGATKFIRIKVEKARDRAEAKIAALSVANSNLFKTAMYGENPNFGRIAAAIGASGIDIKEKDLKIKVSPLNKKEINVSISINRGKSSVVVYTSDLAPGYIKINAEYN
ncbi:MAG: bifunctional glutamate N-acetyltransferase/amino-acid acetyltransferase ArgJ [Candidatus Omnitrophota bacterium]